MAIKEIMNWLVPHSIKLLESRAIPPFIIELSVCKLSKFCKNIQNVLENHEEYEDEKNCHWQSASNN